MGGYWTDNTKILLLVGIPCIITTYTLAVIPYNIAFVSTLLAEDDGFGPKLRYYSDLRAWLGVVIVLSLLVVYFVVCHMLFCCKCSRNRNAIVYCYLASIGTGYCAIMDLFFCILAAFTIVQHSSGYLLIMGGMSKYTSLSVGIAWLFTVTAGAFLLNTESTCLQVLAPIIGSLISFGLPLFIVLISGIGHYNYYSEKYFIVSAFVLGIIGLLCYLLAYFVEFQKKKILNKYNVFSGSSTSFGRTPASSTTTLNNTYDSSAYRAYSNETFSYT